MRRILEMVRASGVLRPRDLEPTGIPSVYLSRLCAQGRLERLMIRPGCEAQRFRRLAGTRKGGRDASRVACLLAGSRRVGKLGSAPPCFGAVEGVRNRGMRRQQQVR